MDSRPQPLPSDQASTKAWLTERMDRVRQRTLDLIAPLTDEQFTAQPAPVMGTVAWDVGHIGAFEELWLIERLDGPEVGYQDLSNTFDPIHHPRSQRGSMALPTKQELTSYLESVRKVSRQTLEAADLDDPRLTRDGFVHDMILRHEQQHQENILITLQLMEEDPQGPDPEQDQLVPCTPYEPTLRRPKPEAQVEVEGMVEVPAGTYTIGTDAWVGVYDNERPAHQVELDGFRIARAPVTNAEVLAFIEDGGYGTEDHWSTDGWMISQALGLEHPRFWRHTDDGWKVREMDRWLELPLDQPVCHISYYEAQAIAAWAGARLPTEAEWEVAASVDPETGQRYRFPWGDEAWAPSKGNLGQRLFGPAPVGAYPEGTSPVGCHQMLGDVWEWTSSVFSAYPGFEAYPYEEYSQLHFDSGYQVLRGGSWATWADCAHPTFRNWHQPDHQQLFGGLRLAQDVDA